MAQTNSGLFANTAFEGSIAPSVQVQNPVQNNGTAEAISSIDTGIQNAGKLFASTQANAAQAANDKVLVNFQQDVGGITDAMEQGMSLQEGRMRLRNLNSQYISNYPTMIKDINDLQGKLVSTVGLANVIATGNEATQRANALADQASKAGWPSVQAYTNAQAVAHQADYVGNQLKIKQAQYGMLTTADKLQGYNVIKNYIAAGQPWADARFSYYQDQVDSGAMKPEDAINGLNTEINKETATIGAARGLSGGADSDADPSFLLTGLQDRLKSFSDYNNGTITKTVYENKLAASQAQDGIALRQSSPRMAKLAAASKMLGPVADSVLTQSLSDEGVSFVTNLEQTPNGATDPVSGQTSTNGKPPDLITTDGNAKSALDVVTSSMKKMGSSPTPEQQTSIGNTLSNVFNSVKTYGGTTNRPQDMNSVMGFLADPTTNAWAVKNGGILKSVGDDAHYVVQQQYGNTLLPLIQKEWDQANSFKNNPQFKGIKATPMRAEATSEPVDSLVVPVWNGASVEFRPALGLEKDARVVALARNLNSGSSGIAGPLNTYIRAMSTLQGSSDYLGYYNKNIKDRLFAPPVDANKETTTND